MRPQVYSEKDMADAFERRLQSRRCLPGVGRFSRIFREVDCRRGRPDFVGIRFEKRGPRFHHDSGHNLATACVLSILKACSPCSMTEIVHQSGMTRATVVRALRDLVRTDIVEESGADCFALAGGATLFDVESTAFELKLKSPRRAVFQAQQYTLFAQTVWIVVPPSAVRSFDAYRPVLDRWGIGLASFHPGTHRFRVVVAAHRREPGSREHQAYALLRLVGAAVA